MTLGNTVYGFLVYNLQIYKKNVLLDPTSHLILKRQILEKNSFYLKREKKLLVESSGASFKN